MDLKIYNDSQRAKSNSSGFNYMPYKSQWGESIVCVQQRVVWRVFVCVKKQMCVKSLTFNYQNKIKTPTDYCFHFDSSDWTIQTEISYFPKI